jgi:hypothetical protein
MTITFTKASNRAKKTDCIKGLILGLTRSGKTRLALTLDPEKTLYVNVEMGDLSVRQGGFDDVYVDTWESIRDLMCVLTGPNPAVENGPFSQAHYDKCREDSKDRFDKYDTVFWDGLTDSSRLCLRWSKLQPEVRAKEGRKDRETENGGPVINLQAAYGLLAQELIGLVRHSQHQFKRNFWYTALLDREANGSWGMQIEGVKSGLEIPGILDEILTLTTVIGKDGKKKSVLVCSQDNDFGYPAGDRSGTLSRFEAPDLGKIMTKINSKTVISTTEA